MKQVEALVKEVVDLREKVGRLEAREDEFWKALRNSHDMESREELEIEAQQWNPANALVVAVHCLWKRDARVAPLLTVIDHFKEAVNHYEDFLGWVAIQSGNGLRNQNMSRYLVLKQIESRVLYPQSTQLEKARTGVKNAENTMSDTHTGSSHSVSGHNAPVGG